MKKRYVAFIALATGIAGSALTYAHTNQSEKSHTTEIVKKSIQSESKIEKAQNENKKEQNLEVFNYNKEDINWLTSLIRYSRSEIKKSQNRDLSVNQAMEVILYSTQTLNNLKAKGKSLNYDYFPKSNIQYNNQEMLWLLKDLRNKNINNFQTFATCSQEVLETVVIGDLSKNIETLEEKRLRENKEVVIAYKTNLPTAIQVDENDTARTKEWNITKIYLNEIYEKITGKYIDQEFVKKDSKTLKEEQEAREVFNEALSTTTSKLRL